MKKTFLLLAVVPVLFLSCKKEEGNRSIIKEENKETTIINDNGKIDSTATSSTIVKDGTRETQEHTYRYVAEDGSSAHVTFTNSDAGNFISIRSNNKTIRAEQSETLPKGAVYKNQDVEIKSEGDLVTITQGNNLIELKKARGQ